GRASRSIARVTLPSRNRPVGIATLVQRAPAFFPPARSLQGAVVDLVRRVDRELDQLAAPDGPRPALVPCHHVLGGCARERPRDRRVGAVLDQRGAEPAAHVFTALAVLTCLRGAPEVRRKASTEVRYMSSSNQ